MGPRRPRAWCLCLLAAGCVGLENPPRRAPDDLGAAFDASDATSQDEGAVKPDATPDAGRGDVRDDLTAPDVTTPGDVVSDLAEAAADAPLDVAPLDVAPLDAPPTCAAGMLACAGACVDPAGSAAHCGACGRACLADQLCFRGVCMPRCPSNPAQGSCNDVCVTLSNNPDHCGGCGVACVGGMECSQGACRCRSSEDALCGAGAAARCEAVQYDPRHCGACGNACGPGQECSGGRCRSAPANCDGRYPDYRHDPTHCGGCNNRCPSGMVCSGGSCQSACSGSSVNCGGGCWSLQNDPEHCGSCGAACSTAHVQEASCFLGACNSICSEGYGDCNRDVRRDGCEVDLLNDRAHCGRCNNACPSPQLCVSGRCVTCGALNQLPCAGGGCGAGLTLCGERCRNLANDSRNCGRCANACPNRCAAGVCA
jgi:hypothetical protein